MMRWVVFVAGVLGLLGVMIGAYSAHGLEDSLVKRGLENAEIAERLQQCDIAVRYHMYHALALLAVGVASLEVCPKRRTLAALFFILGVCLFSGGLYSMVFLGVTGHWAIVPSGGLSFMLGWLCVVLLACGRQSV